MKLPIRSEMDCRHVGNLLSQYADGDLPAHWRAQVQAHLDSCPTCTAHLLTMCEAVSFLEDDAKKPMSAMPDLYTGFRERLVTQPSGSSPLARRAQRAGGTWHIVRLGIAGVGLVAAASVSLVWHHRVAVLNEAIQSLHLPDNGPTFTRNVAQGSETFFSQGYRQSDTLWKDGWRWSGSTISNSKHLFRQQNLTTPGGVTLAWKTPLNDAKMLPVINLYWSPADPKHPQNEDLLYTYLTFRHWLKQIARSNKILFADMDTAEETIGGERMNKLTIRHLNTTIGTKPVGSGEYFEPNTLVLWFDANKRLRQFREEFHSHTGAERSEQISIVYDHNPPFDLANCPLPKGWPVIVTPESSTTTTPVANIVNPLWRTMSDTEKQELQEVVDRFACAWSAKDANRLRPLVDLQRPLEVSLPAHSDIVETGAKALPLVEDLAGLSKPRPAGAAIVSRYSVPHNGDSIVMMNGTLGIREDFGLEDIWQRVWAERLAKEPQHNEYHISIVYAYDAVNKLPLTTIPLTIPSGRTYTALPGVNILAWISEKNAEGHETGYAARLFLVKRGGEWKVWQFAREAASSHPGDWDQEE